MSLKLKLNHIYVSKPFSVFYILEDLDKIKAVLNTHHIRPTKNYNIPSGIPVMYTVPQLWGSEDSVVPHSNLKCLQKGMHVPFNHPSAKLYDHVRVRPYFPHKHTTSSRVLFDDSVMLHYLCLPEQSAHIN